MSILQNKVDIIIPVYNAFEDLTICLKSILDVTDLENHRLILVNDCSSDNRILPYLNTVQSQNITKNILVFNNTKNLGFSGTINQGILQSEEHDVILLNSDTIVTKDWINKMVTCAYSDDKIGTVTPLSNNATLCSVPEFCEENPIPAGFTVTSYSEVISECSLRLYPKIPVSNGFCMYIKRELIKKIGLFDADTFEKGYGEENDFSYRAEQVGYHHVICDDLFIYHKGTSSFISAEKKKYIDDHEKILRKRYPAQVQKFQEFLSSDPNRIINENIKLYQLLQNGRKNILYLVQADFRDDSDDNIGGTQLNVKDLTSALRSRYNIFVVARDRNYLNVTAYLKDEEVFLKYYVDYEPVFPEFRSAALGKVYAAVLDAFRIDLVHIHHTKGLSLEMYYQASDRQIPIVTTLHDYYYACPSIKLLDSANSLCIGKESRSKCTECMNAQKGYSKQIDSISVWREESRTVFQLVDQFISPTDSGKKVICQYFPEIEHRVTVIEHGNVELLPCHVQHHMLSAEMNIAFIGGLSPEKGCDLATEMIKNGPDNINWYVFGMMGYNSLNLLEKENYKKTGPYRREELPELFEKHRIDLVCILSVWPETYCYTLSEALQCRIPVIVTDIGALGERVRANSCGWTVPFGATAQDILSLISHIRNNQEDYEEKLVNIEKNSLKTIEKMGNDYADLYNRFLLDERTKKFQDWDKKYFLNGYLLANNLLSISGGDEDVYKRLHEAENELLKIHRSVAYKLGLIICQIKIPFKKQLKAFLFRFYQRPQH